MKIARSTEITIDDTVWVRPMVVEPTQTYYRLESNRRITVILRTARVKDEYPTRSKTLAVGTIVELDKSLRCWDPNSEFGSTFKVESIEVAQDIRGFTVNHVDIRLVPHDEI